MHSSSIDASIIGNIGSRETEYPKDDSVSKSSPIHAILAEIEMFEFFFFKKLMVDGQTSSFAFLPLTAPYLHLDSIHRFVRKIFQMRP